VIKLVKPRLAITTHLTSYSGNDLYMQATIRTTTQTNNKKGKITPQRRSMVFLCERERESSADGWKNLPPATGGQNKVVNAEERSGVRVGGGDGGGGVCHLEEPDGG
jgi:hypothetical protein